MWVEGNGNVIEGNFIGTDVMGGTAAPNNHGVLVLDGSDNRIGGVNGGAANLLSANEYGVEIAGTGATGNLVQGNLIGTDATGTLDLGNSTGVWILAAPSNVVGGDTVQERNVISGNSMGILLQGATGTLVQGNFIGTDVTGTIALGNSDGVVIADAYQNTIGGTAPGAGNIIAFNAGVRVLAGTGNGILSNSIFSNAGLGIELGIFDLVTPNDVGDADGGPNNLQNFPVLTSATGGSSTTIAGVLDTVANTLVRVEFFTNSACDTSGYGEGETFLGAMDVTTDGGGHASFVVTFPAAIAAGEFVTATATADNNTSEFSQCVTAADGASAVGGIVEVHINAEPLAADSGPVTRGFAALLAAASAVSVALVAVAFRARRRWRR